MKDYNIGSIENIENSTKEYETRTGLFLIFIRMLFNASKRALFFTSLPFYWIIFFNYVIKWFDIKLFIFVVIVSGIMSFCGRSWGVIDWLIK
ncbi:MAG: hypothetical protein QXG86_01765 [Candidatus Woesearchaeota archaeon]